MVAREKDANLRICPCCREEDETADHVYQCKANPKRSESILSFRKALSKSTEPNPTCVLIKSKIQQWIHCTPIVIPTLTEFPSATHELIDRAMTEQEQIGWNSAARGFLSRAWPRTCTAQQ